MDLDAVSAELSAGRLPCGLTGKTIHDEDYVVWFPYFITDKKDPFWQYNEWPMLREAFDKWEHKEAFLSRWRESLLHNIAPRVRILVDRSDYLVWVAGSTSTMVVNFLSHGFDLSIPRVSWQRLSQLFLRVRRRPAELHLLDGWWISVCIEEHRIKVAKVPPSSFKEARPDRILLDRSEWGALKTVVRQISRALPSVSA